MAQRELSDREALEVRADRSRRAVAAFIRIGDKPTTARVGIAPGVLPGIGLVLAVVLAVGVASVASTALAGGASASASATATVKPTGGPSVLAVGSPPASASARASFASSRPSASARASFASSRPSASLTSSPTMLASGSASPVRPGPLVATATFAFASSTIGWAAKAVTSGDSSFTPSYDSTFGRGGSPGSLAATTSAGTGSKGADGSWGWTGTWGTLGVPAGRTVVSITVSYDCYLNGVTGTGVSAVRTSLDFSDPAGVVIARLVPASDDSIPVSWITETGPAVAVPATYQPSTARISLVLNASTVGVGGATWHVDNIKVVTTYR